MGRDHDVEASMSGGSHKFSEDCTRERGFDFSMLASRLEEEVACMTSVASSEVWYIDSGASWHMTRIRECFSEYRREDELSDHHGEQGKVYSSRKGYYSSSDRIGRAVSCHKCVSCARIGDGLTFRATTTWQGL